MFSRWIKNGEEIQDAQPAEGKKVLERMESLLARKAERRGKAISPAEENEGTGVREPDDSEQRVIVTQAEPERAAEPIASFPAPKETEAHPETATPAALKLHAEEPQGDAEPALPSPEPQQAAKPAAPAAPEPKAKSKKTAPLILVVEDEPITQRMIQSIFNKRGYETVLASDGIDALMHIGRTEFDLILSDLSMPNCDGFKLVEYLNQKQIAVPVVFLTASDDVEDEIRCLALGARDFVKKPINGDLLLLRTSRILKGAAA